MKRVIGSDEESVPEKKKNVGVEQEKCAQCSLFWTKQFEP